MLVLKGVGRYIASRTRAPTDLGISTKVVITRGFNLQRSLSADLHR